MKHKKKKKHSETGQIMSSQVSTSSRQVNHAGSVAVITAVAMIMVVMAMVVVTVTMTVVVPLLALRLVPEAVVA
jgi:hypothetical protein